MNNFSFLKIPLLFLALTPIFFYSGALFPYVFSKIFFVRLGLTVFWFIFTIDIFFSTKSKEIFEKLKNLFKNPIFISLSVFLFFVFLSVIFSPTPFRAFWGTVERSEGLVSLIFYFGFFIALYLFFSKRDWQVFFVVSVFVFLILFFDQTYFILTKHSLWSFLTGISLSSQQASFMGNTSFLATFYLFSIFSTLILMVFNQKLIFGTFWEKLIFFFLFLMIFLTVLGIFLTSTLGAILGLGVAFFFCLFYFIFNPASPKIFKKASLVIILLSGFCFVFFWSTRQFSFWQKIPALAEVSQLNWNSSNIQTRLIAISISLKSINPFKVGIFRTLFGWGQDHYLFVFQKFYQPKYLQFQRAWFDRAHNKIFDVLTTNGLLALLAYFSIWFFVFKIIFEEKNLNEKTAFLFFAISYFVQNLFLFDTVSSYISFFAFLAVVAQKLERGVLEKEISSIGKRIIKVVSFLFFIFCFSIFLFTLISFRQMKLQTAAISQNKIEIETIFKNLDKILTPYNFAQPEIRIDLLQIVSEQAIKSKKEFIRVKPLLEKLLPVAEEAAKKEKWNAKYFASIASSYEILGNLTEAEKYWKKALDNSSQRQDLLYSLAFNYARQGKNKEAIDLAEKIISLDPDIVKDKIYYAVIISLVKGASVFDKSTNIILGLFEKERKPILSKEDTKIIRNLFNFYLTLFYKQKDKTMFLETLEKGRQFEKLYETAFNLPADNSKRIQDTINAFQARGWSAIAVEEE